MSTEAPTRPPLTATKHEGLGNDFLILVDPSQSIGADDARRWCERRTGVGADGLIVLSEAHHDKGPRMVLWNADGSRAEISGNGLRCVAQALALHAHRSDEPAEFVVRTDAGPRHLRYRPDPSSAGQSASVAVAMGRPMAGPPIFGDWDAVGVAVQRQASVDLGNPHLVALVDDPTGYDMAKVGPAVEADYPDGLNVHLIAVEANATGPAHRLDLVVWERGAGITQACGSGASAAASAAAGWGLVASPVQVSMPGGDVEVQIEDDGSIVLIGPTNLIATMVLATPSEVSA